MELSWPGNWISGREMVVEELVQGRRFANQLKTCLEKPSQNDGSVSSDDLSERILDSFTNALSLLSKGVESDGISQTMVNHRLMSSGFVESEGSGESLKSVSMGKDRRGCNKRRKNTANTNVSKREDSPTLIDDGYVWRKYGQKDIQNFNHPRSYFRCTYMSDQGCPARKHVQKISDEPPVYRTTYFGRHTCENSRRDSQITLDYTNGVDGECSNMIRFDMRYNRKEVRNEVEKIKGDDRHAVQESWPDTMMMGSRTAPFGTEPMVDPFCFDEFDFNALQFDFNDPCFLD